MYYHMMRQPHELHLVRDYLVIELPEKPNIKPKEYAEIPITPELENIPPYCLKEKGADRPKA